MTIQILQNLKCDTTGIVPEIDVWKYKHGVKCNTFIVLSQFKTWHHRQDRCKLTNHKKQT